MFEESPNRRRNQIIAERTQEKVRRETLMVGESNAQLWDLIATALASAENRTRWLGHAEKAREATLAVLAARELRMRGTQTQLPL